MASVRGRGSVARRWADAVGAGFARDRARRVRRVLDRSRHDNHVDEHDDDYCNVDGRNDDNADDCVHDDQRVHDEHGDRSDDFKAAE